VATIADAVIGPTPGIVASRRLASLSLCHLTIATSISFTRLSSASCSAANPRSASPEKARGAVPEIPFVHALLASAHGLTGDIGRATIELAKACRLSADNRWSSIAHWTAVGYFGVPEVRALMEATYIAGVRKAGMPEEEP
jgi:hypothetical protein